MSRTLQRAFQPTRRAGEAPAERSIETGEGARARIVEREGRERIQIQCPEGGVIFEYDPASGRSTISVPSGDLSFHAPEGSIEMVAGKGIQCAAAGEIALAGAAGVTLRSRAAGRAAAGVRVDPGGVRLDGERLSVDAARAEMRVAEGRYVGTALSATIDRAHLVLDRLETTAGRVLSRARNLFQSVQDLHEIKAGRVRALVDGALDLKGGSATLQAEGDVRIDGRKINLG